MLNLPCAVLAILLALAACAGPKPGTAADVRTGTQLAPAVAGEHLEERGEAWRATAGEASVEAWLRCCLDLAARCRPLGRDGGNIQAIGGPACDETATTGHHCVVRCEGQCVYGRPTAFGDPDPTEVRCPLPAWMATPVSNPAGDLSVKSSGRDPRR